MHPSFRQVIQTTLLLVPLLLLADGGELHAQGAEFGTDLRTGIGYSGVFPNAEIGISAFRMVGVSGFGAFVDFKTKASPLSGHNEYCPAELESPCSVPEVQGVRNDLIMNDHDEYRLINGGLVWAPTQGFAFMVGAGLGQHRKVREYFELFEDEEDQGDRLTDSGGYFVPHDPSSQSVTQGVIGILIRAGDRLAVRMGYETAPGGMSASGYLLFPW
jgi:hypothetical protein